MVNILIIKLSKHVYLLLYLARLFVYIKCQWNDGQNDIGWIIIQIVKQSTLFCLWIIYVSSNLMSYIVINILGFIKIMMEN